MKASKITNAWTPELAKSCKFKTGDYVEVIKTKKIGIIASIYGDGNRYYVKFIQNERREIIDEILDESELRKLTRKEKQRIKRELKTFSVLES